MSFKKQTGSCKQEKLCSGFIKLLFSLKNLSTHCSYFICARLETTLSLELRYFWRSITAALISYIDSIGVIDEIVRDGPLYILNERFTEIISHYNTDPKLHYRTPNKAYE